MARPGFNTPEWSDLRVRAASAVILLMVGFICLFAGGVLFAFLLLLAAMLMHDEWKTMTAREPGGWRYAGYVYLILPCACLLWLRALGPGLGFPLTFGLVAVVTATDVGAYFFGRHFGRFKLAPAISPKKTWEGLGGGVICAMLTGLAFSSHVVLPHSTFGVLTVSLILALLAQIGDLFESYVKRRAGVKDSGTLIPGHGGLMDRLDGYMFTAPVLALLVQSALP